LGLLVPEISFPISHESSHLDFICPLKSAFKAQLSKLPVFSYSSGSMDCSAYIFRLEGPNPMKLEPLETRLLKLSRDISFVQFGAVSTELWLREVDLAADCNGCI